MGKIAIEDGNGNVELVDFLPMVGDGCNVANGNSRNPSLDNIILVKKELEKIGVDLILVASSALKHKIDDKNGFRKLIDEGVILEAPAGVPDDLYILEIAREFKAWILSNDRFRQYKERYAAEITRRTTFMIVRGKVIIPSLYRVNGSFEGSEDSQKDDVPAKDNDSAEGEDLDWLDNLNSSTGTVEQLTEGIFRGESQ